MHQPGDSEGGLYLVQYEPAAKQPDLLRQPAVLWWCLHAKFPGVGFWRPSRVLSQEESFVCECVGPLFLLSCSTSKIQRFLCLTGFGVKRARDFASSFWWPEAFLEGGWGVGVAGGRLQPKGLLNFLNIWK